MADLSFAWRVVQARQVERDRLRQGRRDGRRRRGPDVARRFRAHRRAQGGGRRARRGLGRAARPRARSSPPTRSSPSPTASIAAVEAGATAVIQPGGSVRDAEVIAAADAAGIAMVVHRHAALPALKAGRPFAVARTLRRRGESVDGDERAPGEGRGRGDFAGARKRKGREQLEDGNLSTPALPLSPGIAVDLSRRRAQPMPDAFSREGRKLSQGRESRRGRTRSRALGAPRLVPYS